MKLQQAAAAHGPDAACIMPMLQLGTMLSCRLLLEITAMRYGCVNHTTFATCAADQSNWCTWHEEARRCGMYYDDADFVHLMLWSGTKVACNGEQSGPTQWPLDSLASKNPQPALPLHSITYRSAGAVPASTAVSHATCTAGGC